jgi:hypothetical protein
MQKIAVAPKRKAFHVYLVKHGWLLHRKALSNAVLVHSYVSSAKDSVNLLDVMASAGDSTMDVTGASVARRPALYPDVRKRFQPRLYPIPTDPYLSISSQPPPLPLFDLVLYFKGISLLTLTIT